MHCSLKLFPLKAWRERWYNPHMATREWLTKRVTELERELLKARALKVKKRECQVCGQVVKTEGYGRPRLYCSDDCRVKGKRYLRNLRHKIEREA